MKSLGAAILFAVGCMGEDEANDKFLELALFMPMSTDLGEGGAWLEGAFWKANSAMALMAVDHFNERNSNIVADLANYDKTTCPIVLNGNCSNHQHGLHDRLRRLRRLRRLLYRLTTVPTAYYRSHTQVPCLTRATPPPTA
jgi:hypothetical protein